ncbi:MAG: restriction endonuclease subunit M [Kiritimatiellia bacterium]
MNLQTSEIDIRESILGQSGDLLKILLSDHSTEANIIWATDSYEHLGPEFSPTMPIMPDLIIGERQHLIQPRAAKTRREQRRRTQERAEVFTRPKTIGKINRATERGGLPRGRNWQAYVRELRLEITCGEAPFIVSRYNPTAHTGRLIALKNRVGFLDRKLRTVSKFCSDEADWLVWAKEAFKASYGYEWQGDNVLLARENLLYTLIDYYQDKFGKCPTLQVQEEFAGIISWNIFQMDGLKYVVPLSCHQEIKVIPGERRLFETTPDTLVERDCVGCQHGNPRNHNGQYAKIMDWEKNQIVRFVDQIRCGITMT